MTTRKATAKAEAEAEAEATATATATTTATTVPWKRGVGCNTEVPDAMRPE
jgi:hypothetical protein